MKVYNSRKSLEGIEKGWSLTIGNFDGVHLGHQEILCTAREANDRLKGSGVAVMTFDPHPAALIRPEHAPGVLTPIPMRTHLLAKHDADCLIILKDDFELLNLSPKDFVDEFLMKIIQPVAVVEGPNFNFGYGRSGDVNTLKNLAAERNFEAIEVTARRLKSWTGKNVMFSSTLIRNALGRGDVVTARKAMGRCYRLVGQVIQGRGIGKDLGYPTANIQTKEQFIPAEGVYAGMILVADSFENACTGVHTMTAVFSIGRAKTFLTDYPLLIEAHALDEDPGDLYGKWLGIDFVQLIRGQRRFDSPEELRNQIALDCDQARRMLAKEKDLKD